MATWTRRERTVRHVEHLVPAPAAYAELCKAVVAAERSLRKDRGWPADRDIADDDLIVTVTDDAVVIGYTVDVPATPWPTVARPARPGGPLRPPGATVPDQTPAQQLRTAATLLRRRAGAIATPDPDAIGPWHVANCAEGNCPCIVAYHSYAEGSGFEVSMRYVADAETPEYAKWIALMSPGVGLALADWLEAAARRHDAAEESARRVWQNPDAIDIEDRDRWIAGQADQHALAVARMLLGRPS